MAISDINMPEFWVAGFAFMVPTVVTLFKGVVLLDIRTLGADESLPTAAAVVGAMLAPWWFDDG